MKEKFGIQVFKQIAVVRQWATWCERLCKLCGDHNVRRSSEQLVSARPATRHVWQVSGGPHGPPLVGAPRGVATSQCPHLPRLTRGRLTTAKKAPNLEPFPFEYATRRYLFYFLSDCFFNPCYCPLFFFLLFFYLPFFSDGFVHSL